MHEPVSIVRPADLGSASATPRRSAITLSPQQLAKARSRLAFLTLIFAVMCALAVVLEHTLYAKDPYRIYPVYIFNGITSLALFALTRWRRIADRWVLGLALVYEVLMCLSVSMGFVWIQYQFTATPPGVTWAAIVIVAFPLIVPTPPWRTFVAALSSAAMVPLSLYLLQAFGWATPAPFDYVHVAVTPIICVGLAVLGSLVIYGLNVEVARARQMGSYRLEELLGRGGMGEVWRARHRLLARPAAVKLVRPEITGSQSALEHDRLLERFKREAQVTAGLQSPHTVDLYDFGRTDDGVFYYVMELLSGLDLERLVRRHGPMDPGRVAHLLLQACHSLREAHEQEFVHRDIKPANLIVCRRRASDHDVLKVLDFGLVALRPQADPERVRLTAEGQVSGTPAYMPPEAVAGERVDARADLYALGCVAYWMVTGQQVFEATTPMAMAVAHVREEPVPPSKRSEIEIPGVLERIILDCLEKAPDRRPQSAVEVAERLAGTGLGAGWTQGRAREWWALHHPEGASAGAPPLR